MPPGPPVARVAVTTDHSIEVEWDPPADNGGGEIMGYHVDKVKSFSQSDFSMNKDPQTFSKICHQIHFQEECV